jgi:hypothetical protein
MEAAGRSISGEFPMKHPLTIKIMAGVVLSCLLTGLIGCSKKPAESDPSQSQVPKDSMQKAYGSGNRPGASAQSR